MPVMHTRKPIRAASDGYFEKHQTHPHSYQGSKYSSKYEPSRSTSYGRDRDRDSPIGMNGYRSVSPDIDSPRDRSDRDRDRDRYQSSNYLKRDRDYKKDKYVSSEKRGRERELDHRNNHDSNKRSKLSSKRDGSSSNSDDRDRGRDREREPKREREHERERERDRSDRDRDRDRERERGDRDIKESSRSTSSSVLAEKITRVGDWSEHVSKSGKKYYYNCKTEVSQWDKPREWIEKERALTKELHRDSYRERDRERDKEDRYTSSSSRGNYGLHSRGNSRVRWTHDSDLPPTSSLSHHRSRRHDEADMEISPDSTPTSEAGYSHHSSSTPTATTNNSSVINISNNNLGNSEQSSSNNPNSYSGNALPRILSSSATNSSSSTPTSHNIMSSNVNASGSSHHHHHHYHSTSSTSSAITHSTSHNSASSSNTNPNQLLSKTSVATASGISIGSPSSVYPHHIQTDAGLNSNAPGPPANGTTVLSGVGLPKILSHISVTSGKPLDAIEHQKSLLISRQHSASSLGTPGILEGSPIYNIVNHSNQQSSQHTPQHTTNYYSSSSSLAQQLSVRSDSGGNGTLAAGNNCIDGPPTPTQEKDLDLAEVMSDHRKLETSSSSLLNCVMTTVAQTSRSQGPNLTSSLANYCRLDLIQHIKDWPADYLEHQAKKCSEEAHYYSDIQCSQVSTELKCARSVVRLREIRAFLQEQKLMFLRQQIQRIEQLLSQNPYMSTESNDL